MVDRTAATHRLLALLSDFYMLNGIILFGKLAFMQPDRLFVGTAASALFLRLSCDVQNGNGEAYIDA